MHKQDGHTEDAFTVHKGHPLLDAIVAVVLASGRLLALLPRGAISSAFALGTASFIRAAKFAAELPLRPRTRSLWRKEVYHSNQGSFQVAVERFQEAESAIGVIQCGSWENPRGRVCDRGPP